MDSGLTAYRAAIDALFARTGSTSRLGLERTRELLAELGDPHEHFRSIHVAGTNGKGSVVAILYALLRSRGMRVGRYTSPHLIDFCERIVVNEEPVDEEYVVSFLERSAGPASRINATFFEVTTAMAFAYFAEREVDVAIIETGLGGRLDATNVIRPMVAGITSIAIDHVEFLGDTEEAIAREKAGIFKPGVPAVVGAVSADAREAIERVAVASGVPPIIDAPSVYPVEEISVSANGTRFLVRHDGAERYLRSGLAGTAQARNTSVALAMLWALGPDWRVSLQGAEPVLERLALPGRFQIVGQRIFDVAHNPDGMRQLVQTLSEVGPRRPIDCALGVLADKDWRAMILSLAPQVDGIRLVTPPSAPAERAWRPEDALAFCRERGIAASIAPGFADALAVDTGTLLVTGSFHTVGDALVRLGLNALR